MQSRNLLAYLAIFAFHAGTVGLLVNNHKGEDKEQGIRILVSAVLMIIRLIAPKRGPNGELTGGFFPIQIVPKKAAEQKEEAAAQPSNKVKIPPLIYFAASAVAAGSALYECSRPSMEIKNQVLYPSLFVSTLLSLFVDNFIPR